MNQRLLTVLVVLMAILVAGLLEPVTAGQQIAPVVTSTARRSVVTAARSTMGVIAGQALNADRTPLAFARVRLRNLDSGAIIDKTAADHLGEFSFLVPSRGNYVAELFDAADRVLAVGEAVRVEAGQTVGTLLLLSARTASFGGLFGNSAAAIVSAAAGAGITAVTATGQPLSPEQ